MRGIFYIFDLFTNEFITRNILGTKDTTIQIKTLPKQGKIPPLLLNWITKCFKYLEDIY